MSNGLLEHIALDLAEHNITHVVADGAILVPRLEKDGRVPIVVASIDPDPERLHNIRLRFRCGLVDMTMRVPATRAADELAWLASTY